MPGKPSAVKELSAVRQLRHQLGFVWKFPSLMFGIDHLAVHLDVEDATTAGDESGIGGECLCELGSQTGRPWFVVSLGAISNADFHGPSHVNDSGLILFCGTLNVAPA